MKDSVVDVVDVSKRFGTTLALHEVNFAADEGLVYGLVGANGVGKTTLIKHILGLYRTQSGSVRVFGQDPVAKPVEVLKRIGYVSDDRALPEWMRIGDLMRYTQAYHASWDSAYAHELLDTFQLDTNNRVQELSRGMRAQACLVAAVSHRPDLLIMDEPSSGLDAVVRRDILNAIVRTVTDDGRTVIFSSHLLEEVERMSDHLTMIHDGRVVFDGRLEAIKQRYQHTKIRFAERQSAAPSLAGAMSIDGEGRAWNIIHEDSIEKFQSALSDLGGEVVESRGVTLEELFVARVGRPSQTAEAA
ncbi:MAG: ABC transporter ATP-binding protein [Gammaproteobacteria bacterium]|nr:ABC transporter ATP-binding protein [Gammaproteobacteria bacterium]